MPQIRGRGSFGFMTKNLIERNRFASQLVERELADITHRYGNIDRAGSSSWLPYHNASHAKDVHDASFATAQKLAATGRIDPNDIPLVRIAAVFHDHEQNLGSGPNESHSADIAVAALAERPDLFDVGDIAKVRAMILGTTVSFVKDPSAPTAYPAGVRGVPPISHPKLVQAANPSSPLEAVVADADLGALGHVTGLRQSLNLLAEMESKAGRLDLPRDAAGLRDVELSMGTMGTFLSAQHDLLSDHRYLLDINEKERGPQREENLRATDEAWAAVLQGASFGQVLDGAVAYARGLSQGTGFERGAA